MKRQVKRWAIEIHPPPNNKNKFAMLACHMVAAFNRMAAKKRLPWGGCCPAPQISLRSVELFRLPHRKVHNFRPCRSVSKAARMATAMAHVSGPHKEIRAYGVPAQRPASMCGWTGPYLCVSVENRKQGVLRIAHLQAAETRVRFLSVEPLLEDWRSSVRILNVSGEGSHPSAQALDRSSTIWRSKETFSFSRGLTNDIFDETFRVPQGLTESHVAAA
jgi:hypothetical protein